MAENQSHSKSVYCPQCGKEFPLPLCWYNIGRSVHCLGCWYLFYIDVEPNFQPITLDSCWLTSSVRRLAQSIQEEETFERLPILADALEEAGCDNVAILEHCRQPGPHVKHCWVIELIHGRQGTPITRGFTSLA